ncbi:MAG: insulinase family protein [Proteobacteria bacterium]|nr:insulinase family protein [Pseudomonadota bacterium]
MPVLFMKRTLLSVVVAVILVACATVPSAGLAPSQSPNDENQYRFLVLENELQVLLISDPDTRQAAGALDVMVGSGDNPPGRGGLAHFLEHMLFLGTEKYPNAAEYEQYTTEHGGRRNAYTSFEHTNYFFDINEEFLPEALDRFAQFFIAPKFDAQYVDREKNAVQAEYQMGLKSDGRRGLDVLQEVMNPEHPFSQFSVGSLESLADRPDSPVRDELLAFYDKHYSANVMRLVVLGSQSLDELEKLVVPMFTPVPNKSFTHSVIGAPMFTADSLPMLVQVKPQATLRQLSVSFPIADYRGEYHVKPVSYLGNLVGHEGGGSLLSQLKAEGLAESLSAGSGLAWRGGALFSVNITLTEKGVDSYLRVLQLLYSYMDMVRKEGPQQRLYDEQSQLAELGFRFKEDVEPMSYVSALAQGMHYYQADDILRGPYLMTEYDSQMLSALLNSIVPGNALVTLDDANVETDETSVHYQVPYSRETVTGKTLANWKLAVDVDKFHLPVANNFIAQDVSLKAVSAGKPAVPAVVLESERQKIWFMQDAEFGVPKGASYINFRSPHVGQSADQTAAAVLYAALLKDSVNEFAYPALLAGLNFNLYKHAQGISLRIGGYDDKQALLLDQLLDTIRASTFAGQRFNDIRKDMIRSLQNSVAKRPSSQVIDDLREALLYGEWGEDDLITALEAIDLAGLQAYAVLFWRDAQAEIMIYGNYDRAIVEDISAKVATLLSAGTAPKLADLEVLKLAGGESLLLAADVPHDDSVVAWYLQGGGNDWSDRAATALTAQIMKSGFFQQLRTEQQLGYIVSAFSWAQRDVPALVLLVQSPGTDAAGVAAAMDTFMRAVESELDKDQFERHKTALMSDIQRPDKNIWERAEFYWQSIAKHQDNFDARQSLTEAVDALTLETWLAYYNRVFLQDRHSLQVVAPGKWGRFPQGESLRYNTPAAVKQGHETYITNQ